MTDEELQKLLAEATPGPWIHDEEDQGKYGVNYSILRKDNILYDVAEMVGYEADARLIAAAPDLAREVLALRKVAEALVVTREKLLNIAHSEFDGVWNDDDFSAETAEADAALSEWEALP